MSSQESTHTEEPTARPPRRKVVAYQLLSLDGVAEDPDRFISVWEDAADAHLAEVIASQDAVILGRRSHDVWAEFWPGSEIEPFASFINAVPKYVATSTPLTKDWANTEAIEGGLVDFVHRLRRRPGGDIGVHASISVTRALLAADLVDELSLVVAPATAATGRRLFEGLPPMRLELVRGVASPGGHLLADYRVVRRPAATS